MILSREERGALTIQGDTIAAQIRDGDMALVIRENAPRSTEDGHPVIVSAKDVLRLYALLSEARGRFELMPEYRFEREERDG